MMADRRDFYDVLGVPRDAKPEDIQRAYRKLARTYHPDVNREPGAEGRFTEVSEAYDVLSDPESRRRYDAFGHEFNRVPEGVDPDSWARARAAGAGGGAGTRARRGGRRRSSDRRWFSSFGGEDADIDDLLGGIGSGSGSGFGRGWGPISGADQEAQIEVTVEEAFSGVRRSLAVGGPDGDRTITVTIPAGVTEGQRIRLAGQGGRGTEGAPPGDLYLVVRIAAHPRYRLEGRDIHVELPLSPWEGALGATVVVDTPGGEAKAKVAPGTSSGRRLRLRGRGLPNPRGRAGDVIAEVRIMVPRSLTAEERRLFEALASTSSFDPRRR